MKKTIVGLIILAAALTTTAALYTQSLKPIKSTNNNTKLAITASTQNTADSINASTDSKTAPNVESEKTITKPKASTDSINNNTINNTQSSSNSSNVVSTPSTSSNMTITNNLQPTVNNDKNNINNSTTINTNNNISTAKSNSSNSKKSDDAPSITTNKTTNSTVATSTNSTSKTSSNTKSDSNTTNVSNNTPSASSSLEESEATFDNNNNSSSPATFSALQAQNKKYAPANTAIVTNLNDYKIVNGKKYYNIYEYKIGDSASDWVFDGNHSNFLGAKYMNVNGDVLNNQYVQNFSSLTTSEKATQIQNVANQFVGYFNYDGPVKVHMDKQINFDGYTCYLVTFGNKSFYMNPAGFIYINKSQSFY